MEKAKEQVANMAPIGPNTTPEPVAPTKAVEELVGGTTPINNNEHEQEITTLKEELVAQEAL